MSSRRRVLSPLRSSSTASQCDAQSERSGQPKGASPAAADRFANINGLRLHYLDWGAPGKQPLILLNGIARTAHAMTDRS